jgi:hypothetical protein
MFFSSRSYNVGEDDVRIPKNKTKDFGNQKSSLQPINLSPILSSSCSSLDNLQLIANRLRTCKHWRSYVFHCEKLSCGTVPVRYFRIQINMTTSRHGTSSSQVQYLFLQVKLEPIVGWKAEKIIKTLVRMSSMWESHWWYLFHGEVKSRDTIIWFRIGQFHWIGVCRETPAWKWYLQMHLLAVIRFLF